MLTLAGKLLLMEPSAAEASVTLALLRTSRATLRVEHAASLSAAKDHLDRGGFDAVLLDPLLPDARELAALESVVARDESLPVIVWSSVDHEELALKALRLGAEDFLVKGTVDGAALTRSLRFAIERKKSVGKSLRAHDARTSILLEAIPDSILRIHRSGNILDFKPPHQNASEGFDTSRRRTLDDLFGTELASRFRDYIAEALERVEEIQVFEFQREARKRLKHYETRLVASGADEVLSIVRDVTERKELEEKLRLAQRLEAVGRLAGGIAHDFNNILTVIHGNAELALMSEPLRDETRQSLEGISATAERAANLTRQLLAFSRKQVLKPVSLDLNAMVLETTKMLRRLIGENITLDVDLKSEFSTVIADPAQIEQILLNLAVNARDAMPDEGKLLFQTEDVEVYETYVGQEFEVASGPYVSLVVSDTGIGMEPRTRARAFEPFFTTKERGRGTGLGLSTVYGIVKQSGGYIWIYSEPNVGTTVKIYLPTADAEATFDPSERTRPAMGVARGETILLVEDDPQVLAVAQRFLTEAGYRVIAATGIENALGLVADPSEEVHLLATDVVLSGTSGRELADRLRTIRPGIKTLFVSGYSEEAIARHGVLEEGMAFLEKPYNRTELLAAVRRALDDGAD